MSRDIEKADSVLVEFWPAIREWYANKHPGRNLFLVHVDRRPSEQLDLFCQGRLPNRPGPIVTYKDGYNCLSKHNMEPSQAIDVGVLDHGSVVWPEEYFKDLGQGVIELGYLGEIIWGGNWQFKDWGHFEVKDAR